jgi:hypothetical protein
MLPPDATFPQPRLSSAEAAAKGETEEVGMARWQAVPPQSARVPILHGLLSRGRTFQTVSRQYLGPRLQVWNRKAPPVRRGRLLNGETHGDIDILENLPLRDSIRAVGGFHQIIAGSTAMFTPERIADLQGTVELFGSDQKPRPIDLPCALCFRHLCHP